MYVYSFGSYAAGLPETGQSFLKEFQVGYLLSIYVCICMYVCVYIAL